jgi:hypothetical protein
MTLVRVGRDPALGASVMITAVTPIAVASLSSWSSVFPVGDDACSIGNVSLG